MIIEYFTSEQCSWEQVEKLSGYGADKIAWTVQTWTELARQNFDIQMIERFDYKKYLDGGLDYLKSYYQPEALDWQVQHTNIREIAPILPDFLASVEPTQRSPELSDIDLFLKEGRLVTVQLNGNILNNKDGYADHMILVYDKNGNDYIAHDPGLPPYKSRRIESKLLLMAMGGENNTVEVTGVKLGENYGEPRN